MTSHETKRQATHNRNDRRLRSWEKIFTNNHSLTLTTDSSQLAHGDHRSILQPQRHHVHPRRTILLHVSLPFPREHSWADKRKTITTAHNIRICFPSGVNPFYNLFAFFPAFLSATPLAFRCLHSPKRNAFHKHTPEAVSYARIQSAFPIPRASALPEAIRTAKKVSPEYDEQHHF